MTNDEKCPDCVDGFYQGLLEREKCETCGGSGKRSRELLTIDCDKTPATLEVTQQPGAGESFSQFVKTYFPSIATLQFDGSFLDAVAKLQPVRIDPPKLRSSYLKFGY